MYVFQALWVAFSNFGPGPPFDVGARRRPRYVEAVQRDISNLQHTGSMAYGIGDLSEGPRPPGLH